MPHVSDPTSLRHRRRIRARGVGAGIVLTALGAVLFSPTAAQAATAPDLGTAKSYSVLAASTVTNTGPTTIPLNLGVSPLSAVTGFPPGEVGGAIERGTAAAGQAQKDVGTAYDDLSAQATTAQIPADIGGLTLKPGVYTADGPVGITGAVSLDAEGVNESVFVIRAASTLITASASSVELINGPRPAMCSGRSEALRHWEPDRVLQAPSSLRRRSP